jgi:hypothetical protein
MNSIILFYTQNSSTVYLFLELLAIYTFLVCPRSADRVIPTPAVKLAGAIVVYCVMY